VASFNMSKFNSQINRLKQQTRRAENEMNRAINKCNRDMRNAFNKYNASVRQYNSNVRRNKQIISNELRKLNSLPSVSTSYTISSRNMQTYYDEINAFYSEGIEVTPKQNHILDLVEQEQANSLITENYIERDNAPEESPEDIEIGNKLALVSDDLNNRWKGAVFALNPNNPDATRHFCTSTREIFTEFLEIKAPDEKVFAYNPQCVKTDRGNATRKEKIKYMMRNTNFDDSVVSFVEADIKNILELNHLLSGGTHGPAGKFTFEKLIQVKKRVEQGIIFLCEISQTA